MADLRNHLQELPYSNIQTYIQSGNIVFQHEATSLSEIEKAISNKIAEKYGFEVPTLVLAAASLQTILVNCPFSPAKGQDIERIYFTLLAEEPAADRLAALAEFDYSPERYELLGKTIYFYAPNGYGRAKMNNNFFENQLKVHATTRNWKTVNMLVEMAGL